MSLPAGGSARADIAVLLPRRGRVPIARIKTIYCISLRAVSCLDLAAPADVAGRLAGAARPPRVAARNRRAAAAHCPCIAPATRNGPGCAAFRDGDSPRQIAWPAYARGRGLLVKTYQSPAAHQRYFDLATVPGADLEQRLEQLSAWIVAAHARGERYGLRLAEQEIAPDSGNEHRARCLDGLALFGSGEPW